MLSPAPLYNDLAVGPKNGTGHWVTGQDGVRIRIGVWNSGAKGTVLIFPGRTEYIEKYGGAARELSRHGYSSVAVDWRGQGLADRLQLDRNIGHVINFTDYQYDVQAMLRAADTLGPVSYTPLTLPTILRVAYPVVRAPLHHTRIS